MNRLATLIVFCIAISILGVDIRRIHAQGPVITQSLGLTLERDDFPPAAPVAGSPTVYASSVSTRNSFAIVFRNGLLQRACGGPPGPCDYNKTGNVTATFPADSIQAGDSVTMMFYK